MNFVFEILIIAILIGGAYAGIKYGFIKLASKPLKFFASLFFAFSLCSVIGKGIIAPIIQTPLSEYVKSYMYARCAGISPEGAMIEVPTVLKISGAVFNIDVSSMQGMSADAVIGHVVHGLTSPFVNVCAIVIAFIVLFFVGKLLIALGIHLVQQICDGGVLAVINKTMGFVLAGFLSLLAAWAFVGITEFVFHLPMLAETSAVRNFNGGQLYNFFNSISPLELLLSF